MVFNITIKLAPIVKALKIVYISIDIAILISDRNQKYTFLQTQSDLTCTMLAVLIVIMVYESHNTVIK